MTTAHAVLVLCIAGVFGSGFVFGTLYEACKRGGSLDLAVELALRPPASHVAVRRPYPFHDGSPEARDRALGGDR